MSKLVELGKETNRFFCVRIALQGGESMLKDERGNLSVEAGIVVPLLILFVSTLLLFNLKVYSNVNEYAKIEHEAVTDYADTHRKVSSIYDACENIYEILFG